MNTMKLFDIVILTDSKHVSPLLIDDYTKNVITEDALIQNALGLQGLRVLRLSWDDKDFDWSSTAYILFRSTWDYFNRFDEFSKWLIKVSKLTTLLNSEEIILWNIDKHYLLDLKNKGIHIPKTYFIEKDSSDTLKDIHLNLKWTETILKPCVSGAARHTYKLNLKTLDAHETIFKTLIKKESMMLQPFQNNIVEKGEISMMVFNGFFTHAVLKKAKKGDFRVQDDFGGSVHQYTPSKSEIDFAVKTVKACKELPIYARVDIFTDNDGEIALSELELIEPELWFRLHPEAAHILAKAIKNKF